MAGTFSFDVVSKIDMQELQNGVNQANKEISQRYDFKGSLSRIEQQEDKLVIFAEDEFKLKAVIDILQSKLIKRNISLKVLDYQKIEDATKGTVRQEIKLRQGIDKEQAKIINGIIKELKLKVTSQIQDDQLRVSGKDKDELQKVIQTLKGREFALPLQFINFR